MFFNKTNKQHIHATITNYIQALRLLEKSMFFNDVHDLTANGGGGGGGGGGRDRRGGGGRDDGGGEFSGPTLPMGMYNIGYSRVE